jgi:hypothetical protein
MSRALKKDPNLAPCYFAVALFELYLKVCALYIVCCFVRTAPDWHHALLLLLYDIVANLQDSTSNLVH